jgi:uncharacterized membrane protein YtjA (UPF0391 family)
LHQNNTRRRGEFLAAAEQDGARLRCERRIPGDWILLGWALIFFLLAIIAGYFGFFGLAGLAARIAKVLFLIFLVLLVVSFLVRALHGKSVL